MSFLLWRNSGRLLPAPIRMTCENRSIRQPSGNLQEFQAEPKASAAPPAFARSFEECAGKQKAWPRIGASLGSRYAVPPRQLRGDAAQIQHRRERQPAWQPGRQCQLRKLLKNAQAGRD